MPGLFNRNPPIFGLGSFALHAARCNERLQRFYVKRLLLRANAADRHAKQAKCQYSN